MLHRRGHSETRVLTSRCHARPAHVDGCMRVVTSRCHVRPGLRRLASQMQRGVPNARPWTHLAACPRHPTGDRRCQTTSGARPRGTWPLRGRAERGCEHERVRLSGRGCEHERSEIVGVSTGVVGVSTGVVGVEHGGCRGEHALWLPLRVALANELMWLRSWRVLMACSWQVLIHRLVARR